MNEIERLRMALARASHLASGIASRRENPEETIRRALEAVRAVLVCDVAVLALVEPNRSAVAVVESTDPAARGVRAPLRGLAATIAGWNRGEVIPDAATDPRRDELVEKTGMRHTMCVPVRVKGAPRGTLFAARKIAGTRPTDAADLTLLNLFADVAAIALAEIEDRRDEQAFHDRLSQLASRSFDRWTCDELDPAVQALAKERGIVLDAGCDPILPEIGRALNADAVAISASDESGTWRIVDAWNLPDDVKSAWSESGGDVLRQHRDGRFSCVAAARGFGELDQDLRVVVKARGGSLVLHVLAKSGRGAFSPRDVRCAEMAAVRLGWAAHAITVEEELKLARETASLETIDTLEAIDPILDLLEEETKKPEAQDQGSESELDALLPKTWAAA